MKNRTCQQWVARLNQTTAAWHQAVSFQKTKFNFSLPDVKAGATPPADFWFATNLQANAGFMSGMINPALMPQLIASNVIDFSQTNAVLFIGNDTSFYGQAPVPLGAIGPDLGMGQLFVPAGEGDVTDMGRPGVNNARNASIALMWEGRFFTPGFPADPVSGLIEAEAIAIHELAHWFGLGDIYPFTTVPGVLNTDRFDLMANTFINPSQCHIQAYWREKLSILPSSAAIPLAPRGTNLPFNLTPAWRANPGNRPVAVRIPLGAATIPFQGYYVEARMETTAAEAPAAPVRDRSGAGGRGVTVSMVDETVQTFALRSLVQVAADLEFGGSFSDPTNGITVNVTGQDNDGYTVQVTSNNPNPSTQSDLRVAPWLVPPAGNWESPDIWINSDANDVGGVVRYAYTDVVGNPVGNGDPPFVGARNTVFVRVGNGGFANASNVTVEIRWSQPVGAGDGASRFTLLGAPQLNLNGGSTGIVSVDLPNLPDSALSTGHGCIKVNIVPQGNEITSGNNEAQENIFEFRSNRNSPWSSQSTTMRVFNPKNEALFVNMVLQNLPDGWGYVLTPSTFSIPVGGWRDVTVRLDPAGPPGLPSTGYDEGSTYHVGVVPLAEGTTSRSQVPLGGVDFMTRLVFARTANITLVSKTASQATVKGCVSPALGGLPMSLQAKSPSGGRTRIAYNTNSAGCVTHTFTTYPQGKWRFNALFVGNDLYGSARSSDLVVNIP